MTVTMHDPVWSTYEVQGLTLAEVAQHIAALPEAGETRWKCSYQVTSWDGQNIADANVEVLITVSMPHWAGVAQRPEAEQEEWKRFLLALQEHEQGHVELAQMYLQYADTLLIGNDESTAAHNWKENKKNLQDMSDQYDDGNDHGRNAGTTITVPEDEEAESAQGG
jgi:predicted secreted Zn-dependent protease